MAVKGFVYRGEDRTVEDVDRRSKMKSGLYDSVVMEGVPTFKPREGENTIRILPGTWKDTFVVEVTGFSYPLATVSAVKVTGPGSR